MSAQNAVFPGGCLNSAPSPACAPKRGFRAMQGDAAARQTEGGNR